VILLWGVPGDDPLDVVWSELRRARADAHLLDQRAIRDAAIAVDAATGDAMGTVSVEGGAIDLRSVGAAYIRPQLSPPEREGADAALIAWADLTRAAVINRPAPMAANNSKPYQLGLIAGLGFDVPETLVTTDPEQARRFRRRHGRVIYKSVSGIRSIVSQLDDTRLGRLADVTSGPTQFQEHIAGDDVRVHVVGESVFATRARSPADDYRYASRAGAALELTVADIPAAIADRCRAAAHAMALPVAGIDLRHTPDDRWVCFEVNPSPAFTFYEHATGQPIGAAIAQLLIGLDARRGLDRHRARR
jgi:glutathione synthase/RimK-type ligase-like ATP-grasp enzyme